MTPPQDDQIRMAIGEQAAEWFVEHDAGPLDASESAALIAWLKASPAHVEEFLGVAAIARDVDSAAAGLDPTDELVARARAENGDPLHRLRTRAFLALRTLAVPRWRTAAALVSVIGVLGLGALWFSNGEISMDHPTQSEIRVLRIETRHGEQRTERLADNSVLHINTDTAITVRYSKTERLIVLESGEADFDVAHDGDRAFRVLAGPAQIVAHGTQFDVRLEGESTLVSVIEGRVAVAPSVTSRATGSGRERASLPLELHANQQVRVDGREWPAAPTSVDADRAIAWLQHQIYFDHEPLERVAAEFNRYSDRPIEIVTPALRKLEISGTFSTDTRDEFLAFLRSLDGVRVDVTATRILVSAR